MSHQWATNSISSIWPEINGRFLSLQGLSDELAPTNETQRTYKRLLAGFDSISACEMKEFYRFKIALPKMNARVVSRPELCVIHNAFTAWVNFEYEDARAFLTPHIRAYPSDIVTIFFLHMLDFCTGKTTGLKPLLVYCDDYIPNTHYLYPYYLSIKSFVLCENQCFEGALAAATESVDMMPDNIYGIHAPLAFSATNQSFLIEKLIVESDGFGIEPDAHSAGIGALAAILLFTANRYDECLQKLSDSQEKWSLLVGSRAQRKILALTMEYASQKTFKIL